MVTEPGDLTNTGWDGNTEDTHATNAMASEKGYPARTQDGQLVRIVSTRYESQKLKVLVDADGNEYVDHGVGDFLIPYSSETIEDEPAEPFEAPMEDTVEASEEDLTESA